MAMAATLAQQGKQKGQAKRKEVEATRPTTWPDKPKNVTKLTGGDTEKQRKAQNLKAPNSQIIET